MRLPSRLVALLAGLALLAQPLPLAAQVPGKPAPALSGLAKPEPLPTPDAETERPDPPALVGRLARLQGEVMQRLPGQEGWQPAALNFPLSTGQALWLGPDARAVLQVASAVLVLEAGSRLEVVHLAEDAAELALAEGSLGVSLAAEGPELPWRVATPRGDVLLSRPGRFLLDAGAEDRPTRVAVLAGSAAVLAEGMDNQALAAGQAVALTGHAPPQAQLEAAPVEAPLLDWAAPPAARAALPPAVAGMTGAEDLASQGQWQQSEEHGAVWLPPVEPGWTPYRDGRWAWLDPWGWTWVDAAPWGFAPFHYGRWVSWQSGWAWAPGLYGGPSWWPWYAPALVAFLPGLRPGWMGWAPLRPWQAYHPPYFVSPGGFRHYNQGQVRDLAAAEAYWHGHRGAPPPGAFHPHGGSLAPHAAMTGSRPIGPLAQPLPGGHPGPVAAGPALAPLAATLGGLAVAGALAHRALLPPRPMLAPSGGPRPFAPAPRGGFGAAPPYPSNGAAPPRQATLPPANAPAYRPPPPTPAVPRPNPAPNPPPLGGKPGGWGGAPPAYGKPNGGWGGGGGYGGPSHPGYAPPRYNPPQQHGYAPSPQYSAPHYSAPSYSAPRYAAPAPHFSAPAPAYRSPSPPPSRQSAPSHGSTHQRR